MRSVISLPGRRSPSWHAFLTTWVVLASSLWTLSAQAADKIAADYFVSELPGAPEPLLRMYAGHVEITPEHHGNVFFWLYKNRHIADRQRTIIWLNGGPGCSSMDGALMEIGPYRVNPDGTLRLVDGGWDEFANVLFIDNPVGTGFSYVDTDSYVHELDEMASQMVTFLDKFFQLFPEQARNDIYVAGESYAGQHIPYIAQAIVDRNAKNPGHEWNLTGLLIGNGWISGPEQYLSYLPLSYETGLVQKGSEMDKKLLRQQEICVKALERGGKDHVDTNVCEEIMSAILEATQDMSAPEDQRCTNMYDVRKNDSYPSCGMNWPPDLEFMTPYLRRRDVLRALHVNPELNTGWHECDNQVSNAFKAFKSKPSKYLLPGLLEKMPIILFSGDKDLICNHIGTEDLINKLEWNGGKGMELSPGTWAPRQDWTFEGEPAGVYQTARNLTYIRFYNASHMVPFDFPRRTRDMVDRFLGVDIASIGGSPGDSRIDGEKGLETSVGGHPNSTAAVEAEAQKLKAATWAAYRRSGEVALVFVLIASALGAFFIWRDRRKRAGYRSILGGSDAYDDGRGGHVRRLSTGLGLNGSSSSRTKFKDDRDVEAARDFNEAELDDLTGVSHKNNEDSHFSLADDDEEEDAYPRRTNGHLS